jgi:hypothetical protein
MVEAKAVRLTWTEREAAIDAAFRKLPIKPPDKLSSEMLIPGIARELALMRGAERPTEAGVAALKRHAEAASSAATKKEIAALKKHAEGLIEAIDALHKPAIDALAYRLTGPAGLTTRLRILIAQASCAEVPDDLRAKKGAGVKVQARRIANTTAEHYYRLTGNNPTVIVNPDTNKAYGPFLDLLKEIFDVLGITASAESQAAAAAAGFKVKIP